MTQTVTQDTCVSHRDVCHVLTHVNHLPVALTLSVWRTDKVYMTVRIRIFTHVIMLGNPVCRCLAGYIPMPDTISGCRRECEIDPDCGPGNICDNYRCAPKPDPCDPSPCGPNTECQQNRQGNPVCTCLPGYQPQPDTITGCSKIEVRTPPPDPCYPSPCGPNTQCNVNR